MIGRLHGILIEKQAPLLVIDVQGVGYEVDAPMSTHYRLPALGQPVTLFTHMVVREDAQQLFGFAAKEERALFRELIKISGVGPKMALSLLSGMEPDALMQCFERDDVITLTKIPGVGKKTAERLVMEMRDRLKNLSPAAAVAAGMRPMIRIEEKLSPVQEAEAALVALGYKPADAQKSIAAIKTDDASVEDLIRAALKRMVK